MRRNKESFSSGSPLALGGGGRGGGGRGEEREAAGEGVDPMLFAASTFYLSPETGGKWLKQDQKNGAGTGATGHLCPIATNCHRIQCHFFLLLLLLLHSLPSVLLSSFFHFSFSSSSSSSSSVSFQICAGNCVFPAAAKTGGRMARMFGQRHLWAAPDKT